MKKSKIFTLDRKDALKGLAVAVFGTVMGFVLEVIQVKGFEFEDGFGWGILTVAAIAVGSYITKNWLTNDNDQMLRKNVNAPDETVKKR